MSTTTNAFHIAGGQIIGPNGQPFVAKGIAVLDSEMSTTSPASIVSLFPGINSINLAVGADGNGYATAQSNAAIIAWVNDATSKGLVVTLKRLRARSAERQDRCRSASIVELVQLPGKDFCQQSERMVHHRE